MKEQTLLKTPLAKATGVICGLSLLLGVGVQAFAAPANPTKTVGALLPATERTFEQMAAEEMFAPAPLSADQIPFRPAMNEAEYQTTKQAANRAAGVQDRILPSVASLAPATLKNVNCVGLTQNGWVPPDTHGAIGKTHYVQVTNSDIRVYTKANITNDVGGAPCAPAALNTNLNAFMGYFAQPLFDPRVVYDHLWNRFIVTAEAFEQDASTQFHFVAISKTGNPAGGWWIYAFDMRFGTEFYDYPQLGFDADGLIITANLFNPGYVGSRVTFLSKSRVYNGLAATPIHWGGGGLNFTTIAPPIVRDLGNETWLAAAGGNSNIIRVSRWNNVGHVLGNFLGFVDVPVTAYTVPPAASQPGAPNSIDTLDARFVNNSTQIGSFLYNVHSPNVGGLAGVRRYQINVPAGTAVPITFISSGISSDFNASIAVNDSLSEYITFSRSDTATFPQVRFAGKQNADAGFGLGTSLSSGVALGGQGGRWGDYSACSIDPVTPSQAWCVNEFAFSGTAWGSNIFKIGIP